MAKHTPYITQDGDRWDTIAFKAYGDPFAVKDIIRVNTHVPLTPELLPGIEIFIPIKERPVKDKALLPPWRR